MRYGEDKEKKGSISRIQINKKSSGRWISNQEILDFVP